MIHLGLFKTPAGDAFALSMIRGYLGHTAAFDLSFGLNVFIIGGGLLDSAATEGCSQAQAIETF